MFIWTISDLLGSTFINQGSLKVSAAHKALQELLPGEGFGEGPRHSLSPSLSSLPQTFRSLSAQCPLHRFCQTSKAHPWFLLQNSNGTRQETRQRSRVGVLRENDWKNTGRLNFIPLSRPVNVESEDYLTNTFLSNCWCLSKSFWTGNLWEAVLLMFTFETLLWGTLGFWEEK